MKQTLKKIAIVLIGLVLTLVTVIRLTYIHRGYTRLMGFYALEENTADMVLVGTSVTFSSFMPMDAWAKYGIAGCVYATNVQFENVLRYSLKDICRTQSPKLILVDISPFILKHYVSNPSWTQDWHRYFISYNLDSRRYTLDRFALVKELNDELGGDYKSYWTFYWDITRCHTRRADFAQFNNAVNDPARGYGYLAHNQGGTFLPEDFLPDDGTVTPLSALQQTHLDKLFAASKGLGTEVVFYCPPIYSNEPGEYGIKNNIREQAESLGFGFIDFSSKQAEIGLDPAWDLWSTSHFDALGAEKVTAYLADYLHAHYSLPDRREDAAYANWHTDYEAWRTLKAEYLENDRTGSGTVKSEDAMPGM